MPGPALPIAAGAGSLLAMLNPGGVSNPTTTALPPTVPQLFGPSLNLLQSLMPGQGGQGNTLQQNIGSQLGFNAPQGAMGFLQNFLQNPSSPANLLQQLGPAGSYANYGNAITPQSMTQGNTVAQQMGLSGVASTNPGLGVVQAYEPLFQRNLAQIQGSTPSARFSSGNNMMQTQAMNDFNMFAQQALQQGLGQQIQAGLGAGQLQLGGAQTQGGFQLGSQAQQLPLAQQFLSTLFGAGLPQGTAVGPSPLGQAAGLAGGIGALGTAMGGGQQQQGAKLK